MRQFHVHLHSGEIAVVLAESCVVDTTGYSMEHKLTLQIGEKAKLDVAYFPLIDVHFVTSEPVGENDLPAYLPYYYPQEAFNRMAKQWFGRDMEGK